MLPLSRYVSPHEEVRKPTIDCLVSFEGSRYSVPHFFAKRDVWLRTSKGYLLEIYSTANVLIATHCLALTKGSVLINEDHYHNHQIERGSWKRLSIMFLERFPNHTDFLEELHAQKRINPAYHLTQILDITAYFAEPLMTQALRAASEYRLYSACFIRSYLENHALESIASPPTRLLMRGSVPASPSIERPLSDYSRALQLHVLPQPVK